jgi:hypothetical protein
VEALSITIRIDHKPLIYAQDKKDIPPRLQRWLAGLQHYKFKIEYNAGKDNIVADALSRRTDLTALELHAYLQTDYSDWPVHIATLLKTGQKSPTCPKKLQDLIQNEQKSFIWNADEEKLYRSRRWYRSPVLSLFCASRPCGFNASWQRSPWY